MKKIKITLIFLLLLISNSVLGGCPTIGTPTASVSNVTCSGFTLTWTTSANASHNYIYMCTSQWAGCVAGSAPTLYTNATLTRNYTGLTPGVTYHWRVRSYSGSPGCTGFGGEVFGSITIPQCCSDGVLTASNGETGVDCGGSCAPCGGVQTCFDGILNQDEVGTDCGGVCPACIVSCNDGIQNGAETGVDCGGVCPVLCNQNLGTTAGTSGCAGTELATIFPTNCDQVGTSAFNTNTPTVDAVSSSTYTAPPGGVSCGSDGGRGVWARYELAPGTDNVVISFQGGTIDNGNSATYVAGYNTNSACPVAGDFVSCGLVTEFNSGDYYAYNVLMENLDDTKDLWLFFYNNGGKDFNLDYDLIGIEDPNMPSNTTCESSETVLDEGCNLGTMGASFTTPGAGGVLCGGGNWGSNENTSYYSFTADDITGSLEVDGISCNEGTAGAAQFGVWTSCAAIGSYGAGFLGCQVGSAPLAISPLTPGQTYYIAVDGFAGDVCEWEFTGTGIIMPIRLLSFDVKHVNGLNVITWFTVSERDNDYFTVETSVDGYTWELVSVVDGSGTSNHLNTYESTHKDFKPTLNYYRLKQTDYNGNFKTFKTIVIDNRVVDLEIYKIYNSLGQEVSLDFPGVKFILYKNGTIKKLIN